MRAALTILCLSVILFGCEQHSKDAIVEYPYEQNPKVILAYLDDLESSHQDDPDFFYQKAKAHTELSQYLQAERAIKKAIKLNPSVSSYHLLHGEIQHAAGNSKEAIESLLVAEKLGEKVQELYSLLATEYLKIGELEKAKASVNRLLSLKPDPFGYNLQGEVLLESKDTLSAITSFKKAISIDLQYKQSVLHLLRIYKNQQNLDARSALLSQVINDEVRDKDLLFEQAEYLVDAKAYDSAIYTYRKVMEDSTAVDRKWFFALSNVYYLNENYDSSRYFADRIYRRDTTDLEAGIIVARSLDKLREFERAITLYENMLKSDSTFNFAREELDLLRRKVAYLWQLEQRRREREELIKNPPPVVDKKSIDN